MEITTAAIASIIALVIVVVISCINEDLNVGFLGIGFAIIVGGAFSGLTGAKVMGSFPLSLFMILTGVTFLFGMAQTNGTMEKLTAYSVRLCKGNTALIPLIVFLLTTFVTTIGPGNIAGTALMAPVAMAIATRVGMPAFLMTLIVVGAANGAAFSPFAPTGIIANGIIAKMAPQLGIAADALNGLAWKIHFNSTVVQGIINIGGFFILGGWIWITKQRGATLDIDELAPKPEPFNKHQWLTLAMVGVLILLVVLPGLPGMQNLFPKIVMNMLSNVGSVAFVLSCVLMLTGSGDSKAAVKVMPWGVMMMVCGVSVLIDVMDKAGGLNALIKLIGTVSGPVTANFWLGVIPGIISAYSSSSGVVMPMFLPMVPGLIKEIGGGDPIALISTINVGSHVVDTSPLSTLGALCIACAGDHEDKAKLFRNLLIWGLSMSVVGGIVCYVFFGLLGF
ncbi:SLC13 family permease [Acetonema longum]|uniref:Dicarboxylate carrier MatC domain-containing protein n=1 Tax=Acetonema longum DSM 6540 TaxID=1009370 RepID=F7NNN4_9FIRM|nr:SLC13 family permease [Acetonema longum]EGO62354.1 dicarboxylate carrier MatC domain-containing protein [Acetonema longum DSM 6540]